MSRVLVTGATGFTGSHLASRLRAAGHEVVAMVRPGSPTEAIDRAGIAVVRADIADRDAVLENVRDVDAVYHIAALFRKEDADRSAFNRVNVEGTRNLLDAALAARVRRFVHCSTAGVQGDIDDPPANEDYRVAPGDHYQETKLEGERLALSYLDRGLPVAVVRPVGIYGPGDRRFLKLFRSIARGRFVMVGSGRTLYHLTYIDDLISGFLLAGGHADAVGNVFTIAGPRYTTLRELVDRIADTLDVSRPRLRIPYRPLYLASIACDAICRRIGVAPPLYPRRVEFFVKDRAFDITRARTVLSYEPAVDLDEGLRRTASWYREQNLL